MTRAGGEKRIGRCAVVAAALLVGVPAGARAETWTIASLEWPPFAGPALPRQGAAIHALRESLATVGIDLDVRFYPWRRAKYVARTDREVIGYYPAWPTEVTPGFVAAGPVFSSPLGFAETADSPVSWSQPSDLRAYTMATVAFYRYPEALQRHVRSGAIRATPTHSDFKALQLLQSGRVDTVAIDKYVMRYLLTTRPEFDGFRDTVTFDEKPLAELDLMVALQRTRANQRRLMQLNRALDRAEPQRLVETYLGLLEPPRIAPSGDPPDERSRVRPRRFEITNPRRLR